MITGLHHVAIISSSYLSVEFYEKIGFKIKKHIKRSCDDIVLMEGYGFFLEMFIDGNHPKRDEKNEQIGIRHLALKVTEVEEIAERFKCNPIKTDWNGVRFTTIKDPDNIVIEFHE